MGSVKNVTIRSVNYSDSSISSKKHLRPLQILYQSQVQVLSRKNLQQNLETGVKKLRHVRLVNS